jgi:hypothetical protein
VTGDRCYDFKIYTAKNLAKILAYFLHKQLLLFEKKLIITLVFEKNANLFAENWQKSQKIEIITSTADDFMKKIAQNFAKPLLCQNESNTYINP